MLERLFVHALGLGKVPGILTEPNEFLHAEAVKAFELFGGHEDSDVALVPLYADRLALRGVEDGGEILLGVSG